METHRGEIVRLQIIKSGMKKHVIAEKLRITRQTLDNWLKREDLQWTKINSIGKVLKVNFADIFKEMDPNMPLVEDLDGNAYTLKEELEICRKERNDLRDKYIRLLEEFNSLMLVKTKKD